MKRIALHNFQSYADSVIEPADTLTAITGKSDRGKSSIVRAIEMVRANPLGVDAFIRNGTKEFAVTIDDVTRFKNPTINAYKVAGHEEPFKALRGDVPVQVQESLNITEDNIQLQHDSIFLLNMSAGKVAKKLSSLTDLSATTTALKILADKKRAAKKVMDATNVAITANEAEIHALRNTDDMNNELLKIERTWSSVERLQKKYTTLHTAHTNAVQAQNKLNAMPNTDALEPAKQLVLLHDEIRHAEVLERDIAETLEDIKALQHQLSLDPSKLLKRANKILDMHTKEKVISRAIANIYNAAEIVTSLREQEAEALTRKTELMGDTCPLCGGAIV